MAHFIPCRLPTSQEAARLYFENVFKYHGIPKTIVSDRDPRFTSEFWTSLHELMGIKLAMSTANHPQTDGMTERTQRTLQLYLRNYVSFEQDDWSNWVTMAEFCYNSAKSAVTGRSPFELNYGYQPDDLRAFRAFEERGDVDPEASDYLEQLNLWQSQLHDALTEAQERQAYYANQHRQEVVYQPDEMVYVSSRVYKDPIELTRPSEKLRELYHGPFRVVERIGESAYRLDLPDNNTQHNVFNVQWLKLHIDNDDDLFPGRNQVHEDEQGRYLVKDVVFYRKGKGRGGPREYLIVWEGRSKREWIKHSDSRLVDVSTEVKKMLKEARPQTSKAGRREARKEQRRAKVGGRQTT
ncbi:hypothetical protein SeLEV6574_g08536 [Synchytrium endobioticum]|uniref:Integrase catalytic domain-containing protein n=1 Tax=Synchytrium endobioticum TaxID=286115 RepID=A0A507C0F0_9FUNG|nr:hypothetical protein SeLEV6574_g08536 [Synchytrium endobioticum]